MPCHAMAWHGMIPFYAIPYPTLLYNIKSYHVISYYMYMYGHMVALPHATLAMRAKRTTCNTQYAHNTTSRHPGHETGDRRPEV